jgi:hypothetical protein
MPGFVDVSNMSDLEIKRLGQIDEDDEPRYNRRQHRPRYVKPSAVQYAVADVWAAACAAQRINGVYTKEAVYEHVEGQPPRLVVQRNRDVVAELLTNPERITDADRAAGDECRNFLQNDITFRALKNKLTEFDSATSKVLAVTNHFDSNLHRYELAVIASLPASHQRALERQATQERVRQTSGEYVGQPGDKVKLDVEIIKTNYSQQWNTWYATAITADNHAVFFAYRQQLVTGVHHTILGTVKAHRDGTTQLNRVSILGV